MAKRTYEIGESELTVLRVLWDRSPLSVREVMERLHEMGREVAYTTVLTFLSRLERKGYVTSDKGGTAYVYRPRVSREQVTRSRVQGLLDELFDGAAGAMVLHLVESERLSDAEIARLRRLIKDLDSKK
jgi:BlaI family transcriptional regulator, penicillinase repressor